MSAPDHPTPTAYSATYVEPSGWTYWVVFAAVFMIVVGGMNAIQGLAALIRDEAYWVTLNGAVLTFDITAWGWIHLIFGILLILVGALLLAGSTVARVLGIVLVSLNMLAQFSWATLYPFWALIVIAIDVVVIYALVAHGGELKAS